MKVVCQTDKLLEAVNVVDSVIPGRSTIPALCNIKISCIKEKMQLELTGTDQEHTVVYKIPVKELIEPGTLILPSAKLKGILKETAQTETDLTITSENAHGIVETKTSYYKLVGLPVDEFDFQLFADFRPKTEIEIETSALEDMINKTLFAVSKEITKTPLSGELVDIRPDRIRFIATDAKRLVFVEEKRKIEKLDAPIKMIISPKTLEIVTKVIKEDVKTILLSSTETQVRIKTENAIITSQLLEGTYPEYETIIPPEAHISSVVDKNQLMSALRRVSLLATEKAKAVKFLLSKGLMTLIVKNPEVGEAKVQFPINYDKEDFSIVFNPDYIMDFLKTLTTDTFQIFFSDKMSPALFKASPSHLYVVMPMAVDF